MWSILKNRFQHISPISIICFFVDTHNIKLSDYKDIIDYRNQYQIAFDNIFNLIGKDFWMFNKSIKMIFQGSLLKYLGKDYLALVLAIKTIWKEETINLIDTIFRVICYTKINKNINKNLVKNVNVLTIGVQ